jgi:enoyl-CoA hydratase/carnithine racemase
MAEAEAKVQGAPEAGAATELVRYEVRDGVALLTLNDPPANTYSYDMMRQIDRRVLEARMDDRVQVVVITGEGEKFFCAGANIAMLTEVTPTFKYYFCLHANETLSRLEQTPKIVVAAINGHCVGGGLEVALAADLRVARRSAGRMGLPEINLGVLPGTGGTQRLARIVGKSRAIELMTTGELFDFERGRELGLVNQLFDADTGASFMEQALTHARQFTTPGRAALAAGRIKRAVQTGAEIPFESALALERELQQQLFQSDDAKEGLAAYVEKRKPEFKGK